jgi:hypothetical protein
VFWKRRSRSIDKREYWIAGLSVTMGAGLGVGFTYFCDPDRGHARRKKLADRAVSLIAQGESLVEHKGKNIRLCCENSRKKMGLRFA